MNLRQLRTECGAVEVKHGVRVEVVNLYTDEVGSSELPEKVKRVRDQQIVADRAAAAALLRQPSALQHSLKGALARHFSMPP